MDYFAVINFPNITAYIEEAMSDRVWHRCKN